MLPHTCQFLPESFPTKLFSWVKMDLWQLDCRFAHQVCFLFKQFLFCELALAHQMLAQSLQKSRCREALCMQTVLHQYCHDVTKDIFTVRQLEKKVKKHNNLMCHVNSPICHLVPPKGSEHRLKNHEQQVNQQYHVTGLTGKQGHVSTGYQKFVK